MADAEPQFRRASEYVKGIGESLEGIQNRDVLLRSFEVSERPMRGEPTTFVSMKVSELNALDAVTDYHAWSESLATKLKEIPEGNLPLLVKFERVNTSGGFRVWTFS